MTSDSNYLYDDKGVWTVDAQGHPTLITNITTYHLEGAITLPNTNTWGPLAGNIITGDEYFFDDLGKQNPLIYAINTNGLVTSFQKEISPEDFDIIPAGQDLYCCAGTNILKVSASLFTNYVGGLLITQAGEFYGPGTLFIVNWDTNINDLVIRGITPPSGTDFEHVTFAPIQLPVLP